MNYKSVLFVFGLLALGAAKSISEEVPFDDGPLAEHPWGPGSFGSNLWGDPGKFIAHVRDEDIDKAPRWGADEANPPLSARDALKLASKARATLEADRADKNRCEWWLACIELHAAGNDRWHWVVIYEGFPPGVVGGRPCTLQLPVLMDGKVVMPKQSK